MRIVALAFLLVACSGKKKDQPPPPAPDPAPAKTPPIAEKPKPPKDYNVTCDRILTKDLMDKYFPGRTLDARDTKLEAWSRACMIPEAKGPVGTTVQVSCGEPFVNDETMKKQQEQATQQGFRAIAGVPGWAVRRGGDLRLWDKDASCFVMVHRFTPEEKLQDFARDLEAATGPDDYDKPPKL